jgi:putative restriction endonuclease
VDYAEFDLELFALLESSTHRAILKQSLMGAYFPGFDQGLLDPVNYWDQVAAQIMEESSNEYVTKLQTLRQRMDKDDFEEEIFVRGGVFKRQVPLVYGNACCISGLRIETALNASVLDACHIVPFGQSHDDTISNGLALCPTLHRAFDRGLIAVDPDRHTVMVSKFIFEPVPSVYSIRQFDGKSIAHPQDERWWPRKENLAYHLGRFACNF